MSGRPTRRAAAARRAAIIESSDDEEDVANTTRRQESSEDEFTLPVEEEAPAPRRRTTAGRRKTAASVANTSTTTPRRGRPRRSAAPSVAASEEPSVLPEESGEPSGAADPDESNATVIHNPPEDEEPTIKPEESAKKPAPKRGRKAAAKPAAPRKRTKKSQPEPEPEPEPAREPEPVPEVEMEAEPEAEQQPEPETEPAPAQEQELQSEAEAEAEDRLPVLKASTSPPPQTSAIPLADVTNQGVASPRDTNDETITDVKPIKAMDTILEKPMDIVLKSRAQMTMPVVQEDTGPKPRIVITYLILNNFKSYAGRQEVGPFHASFSSVVGPNGSGKSNVIDSLLFVFGFRASKMRQGKISALIHNSAQYPNLDHCEVAVHFQEVMDLVCSHTTFPFFDT